ncbi:MAG: hypothetical protein ACTSV5_10710 [Promethearchaeota archaeon]
MNAIFSLLTILKESFLWKGLASRVRSKFIGVARCMGNKTSRNEYV